MSKQTTTDFEEKIEGTLIRLASANAGARWLDLNVKGTMRTIKSAVSELVEECKPIECDAPDVINADTADPMDAMNFGFNQAINEYAKNLKEALK